ncbi:MAG: hypothetical protein DYG91_02010 [Chloroflexi bacterium CFX7]|nr:hypothetical protein [Chloroflexi bacterium CFX7]RIL03644.1 MAG: hypothetical protein DCC78_02505 [bacterium]
MNSFMHRKPLALSLGGALILLAAAIIVGMAVIGNGGPGTAVKAEGSAPAIIAFVDNAGEVVQVRVLTTGNGKVREVGTPDHFDALALAPDGSFVAALALPRAAGSPINLHIIDSKSGKESVAQLPVESLASAIAWAPGSAYAGVSGEVSFVLDRAGAIVARAGGPEAGSPAATSLASGGYGWSPDGTAFAALSNGRLHVLRPRGESSAASLATLLPGVSPANVFLLGWTAGPSGASAVVLDTPGGRIAIELGATLSARLLTAEEKVADQRTKAAAAAPFVKAAEGSLPSFQATWSRPTADGAGAIAELRNSTGEIRVVIGSLSDPGAMLRVTGLTAAQARGGALIDAALLPGD